MDQHSPRLNGAKHSRKLAELIGPGCGCFPSHLLKVERPAGKSIGPGGSSRSSTEGLKGPATFPAGLKTAAVFMCAFSGTERQTEWYTGKVAGRLGLSRRPSQGTARMLEEQWEMWLAPLGSPLGSHMEGVRLDRIVQSLLAAITEWTAPGRLRPLVKTVSGAGPPRRFGRPLGH